ncbi:unnamed protein product [Adineta steineri]|uniref:guanylate cyclase n=1 Tax=Adineta steineri TaxID=433720 RepID=A0A813XF25_9BILA|nr:unnamed protein product [Adineta steineri]
MFYGIIMDTIRDGIVGSYGLVMWKRIVKEINLPSETFELYSRYDDKILQNICDCMVEILNDGSRDEYLQFFGENFIRYFYRYGFNKILRVAGRNLRDFLFAIDQLHDSNRFTFPQMQHPLFHVTEENENGVILNYKSVRYGLAHFAIGGLKAAASLLFNENDLDVTIQHDFSNNQYSDIVFCVHFDNKKHEVKRLFNVPSLPPVKSKTFFRIFPFSILMDSTLRIHRFGKNIQKAFPDDIPLIGRPLDEVFRLIRPDIHVEWDKVLSYSRHMVFLMESRLPLRAGSSGKIQLQGQMKYLEYENMLWFLCHPVLGSANDMISAGLHLNDLNLFDNTSDILITGIQQEHELEITKYKQDVWMKKEPDLRHKLNVCHEKNQALLHSTMPKHITLLLQSGLQGNSICECQPFVTIMFIDVMDMKTLSDHLDAAHTITCLNEIIILFDTIADKFDVFKVEIKADGSYMLVSGIHDQSHLVQEQNRSQILSKISINEEERINRNSLGLNPTEIIAELSLEFLHASEHIHNPVTNKPFHLKLGFHSGTAIGGIVGTRNYQYCLFGDTVSIASQITATSEIGRIHLSQMAYSHLVADNCFKIEYRGQVDIKGSGPTDTYWLTGLNEKSCTTKINKNQTVFKCPFSIQNLVLK